MPLKGLYKSEGTDLKNNGELIDKETKKHNKYTVF